MHHQIYNVKFQTKKSKEYFFFTIFFILVYQMNKLKKFQTNNYNWIKKKKTKKNRTTREWERKARNLCWLDGVWWCFIYFFSFKIDLIRYWTNKNESIWERREAKAWQTPTHTHTNTRFLHSFLCQKIKKKTPNSAGGIQNKTKKKRLLFVCCFYASRHVKTDKLSCLGRFFFLNKRKKKSPWNNNDEYIFVSYSILGR